jgi:hypothetical protein
VDNCAAWLAGCGEFVLDRWGLVFVSGLDCNAGVWDRTVVSGKGSWRIH